MLKLIYGNCIRIFQVLTFFSWKRNRSAPSSIPAFKAPDDDKEGSINEEGGSHKYDSLSGGNVPYAGPSPVYESGGFSIPPVSRQSTTFYEGGRPFGETRSRATE
jgi:hypothetical protein